MILLDYSQVALSGALSFRDELKRDSTADKMNLIRHVVISSILNYKRKYSKEYGELIIACDGENYWRRAIFEHYKANRKEVREKSDLDWPTIMKCLAEIREDLKEYFPYRVLRVNDAEADDVIAVLSMKTQDFGKFEPVMIVSSDGDFKQLHKYSNVRQYNPMGKKLVECDNPQEYLIQHIVKAGDDGIPNILSADDAFVRKERQKPVSAKRLNEFLDKGFMACATETEKRNFHRNQTLIDFSFIPEYIRDSILDEFEKSPKGNKNSVMNYLIKNRCRELLNDVEHF